MEEGGIGYFDFINISNYQCVKGVTEPLEYLENIRTAGYATSLTYVANLIAVIEKYNLTQYDQEERKETISRSPLVDYVKISPNSSNPRKDKIKKITIHGVGTDGRVGLYADEGIRTLIRF